MWPGPACLVGGAASNENSTYANQPGSIPTTFGASGIWTPADAAYYLSQGFRGTEWPSLPDPNFASVQVLWHGDRKGQNGNVRMLPPSRSPNDCDGFESIDQGVAGMIQNTNRQTGLYSFLSKTACCVVHNVSNALALGTGNITAEGWIFATTVSTTTASNFWDFRNNSTDTVRPNLRLNAAGKLAVSVNNGATDLVVDTVVLTANVWHHFAWVRDTNAAKSYLYKDGVSVGTPAADTTNYGNVNSAHIANNNTLNSAFTGITDEFRLTLGVAVYPGGTSFTVPTVPFPDY